MNKTGSPRKKEERSGRRELGGWEGGRKAGREGRKGKRGGILSDSDSLQGFPESNKATPETWETNKLQPAAKISPKNSNQRNRRR